MRFYSGACAFLLLTGCVQGSLSAGADSGGTVQAAPARPAATSQKRSDIAPLVAAHQHLLSPSALRRPIASLPVIKLPLELEEFLKKRGQVSGTPPTGDLFTEGAIIQELEDGRWVQGRERIDRFLGFMWKGIRYVPNAHAADGSAGYIAGTVRTATSEKEQLNFLIGIEKSPEGKWQIASEIFTQIPVPVYSTVITADELVRQFDDAGIQRGVLLSMGYIYGSPLRQPPEQNELAKTREENDWYLAQAARFPSRLIAFCGVNPLKDYAIGEMKRCSALGVKGMKLHFANSDVKYTDADHLDRLRRFFRAANDRRMAIVAHIRPLGDYKRGHVETFIREILPSAPDVPVQIAHLGNSDEAQLAFAEAIAAGAPGTHNLYFDTTQMIPLGDAPAERLAQIADSLRKLGLRRILLGTDMIMGRNPAPTEHWKAVSRLPLTEQELGVIASNLPPYMK